MKLRKSVLELFPLVQRASVNMDNRQAAIICHTSCSSDGRNRLQPCFQGLFPHLEGKGPWDEVEQDGLNSVHNGINS